MFGFTYKRHKQPGEPDKHIIFGDLGASHGFSLCTACTANSYYCNSSTCGLNTSVGLVSETDADMFLQ